MKILYVARMFYGRAEVLRSKTLECLVGNLDFFNMYKYEKICGRYLNWLFRKTGIPNPMYIVMNALLIKRAVKVKPDIVWIDKGMYINAKTLKRIKRLTKAFMLSETADNMLISGNNTKDFVYAIKEYDLMVTDKNPEIVDYVKYGAKHVLSVHKGFYPTIHRPIALTIEERKIYDTDVVFCGVAEKDRAESLAYLIKNGINVKIWGNPRSWKKMECHPILLPHISQKAVWWEDYAKALNGAKIALCFLRHISRDKQTQRTFELPACQVMTIAERTADHKRFFEEDKEMVFFSNNEELLDKVKYYLKHDRQREDIAKAGRGRCVDSDYTYVARYTKILNKINELCL